MKKCSDKITQAFHAFVERMTRNERIEKIFSDITGIASSTIAISRYNIMNEWISFVGELNTTSLIFVQIHPSFF